LSMNNYYYELFTITAHVSQIYCESSIAIEIFDFCVSDRHRRKIYVNKE
jgi:hypothetical protein